MKIQTQNGIMRTFEEINTDSNKKLIQAQLCIHIITNIHTHKVMNRHSQQIIKQKHHSKLSHIQTHTKIYDTQKHLNRPLQTSDHSHE